MIRIINDSQHYNEVLLQTLSARHSLYIGTADIKDLYVISPMVRLPYLAHIASLLQKGVDVRIIHAKKPGDSFVKDYEDYPILSEKLKLTMCIRVHFKMVIVDGRWAYFGSANLTGAGMGAKSPDRRNFEMGLFTDDTIMVNQILEEFNRIWRGSPCITCQRRNLCPVPIA